MFPARANSFGYFLIGSAVCLLIVLSTLTTFGQSGRRGSKSPPVSVPTPEPSRPTTKPAASPQPTLSLIVGTDRDAFASIPAYFYDSVLESCAKRLGDSSAVHLEVERHEMTRSEAVKHAKGEKEAFVVWLQLRADGSSQSSGTNLDQVYIEYTVFEPITAKIKTSGHAYQPVYRKGMPIPGTSGRNSTMITESRLRDAAEDAAERILKALQILLPAQNPHP